jgi:uncharacterized protein HemX
MSLSIVSPAAPRSSAARPVSIRTLAALLLALLVALCVTTGVMVRTQWQLNRIAAEVRRDCLEFQRQMEAPTVNPD